MKNGGASLPQLALAHVNVFAENNRSELGWELQCTRLQLRKGGNCNEVADQYQ